jgi:hypothetical protein
MCWLCINAKEAENVALSQEVIAMIPEFLNRPGVLGIGEIGLNKNTKNEVTIFEEHVSLAMKSDELILVHTPHLQDKYKGTRMILDILAGDRRLKPGRGPDRSCGGAHHQTGTRCRVLGGHDAISNHEVHAGTGRGHDRVPWNRPHHGQQRG